MSNYRISQTGAAGWNEKKVCSLEISLGNARTAGDKLQSIVEWAESHFELCLFHIGDTLYRHNFETDGHTAAEARAMAMRGGDEWLAAHADIIESCRIPHEIIRWDRWLTDADFPALHSAIRDLYLTDDDFRRAVMADVWMFMERQQDRINTIGPEKFISNGIAFLLEEAAGDTLLSRRYDIARVYPAPQLETFRYLARPDTPAAVAGLGRDAYTRIALKKRANNATPLPQTITGTAA